MDKKLSTLMVLFHAVGEDAIEQLLETFDLLDHSTLVSTLVPRYAIDVPVGREKHFSELLLGHNYVKDVNAVVLSGREQKYGRRFG